MLTPPLRGKKIWWPPPPQENIKQLLKSWTTCTYIYTHYIAIYIYSRTHKYLWRGGQKNQENYLFFFRYPCCIPKKFQVAPFELSTIFKFPHSNVVLAKILLFNTERGDFDICLFANEYISYPLMLMKATLNLKSGLVEFLHIENFILSCIDKHICCLTTSTRWINIRITYNVLQRFCLQQYIIVEATEMLMMSNRCRY